MTRRRDDPASGLREHYNVAGGAIVTGERYGWGNGRCNGELRALYVRETVADESKPKTGRYSWSTAGQTKLRWVRAGYVCLRCGVVELHPDVLPDHPASSWQRPNASGRKRPGAILSPAAAVDTPGGRRSDPRIECPDCGATVTASNLAKHRRRSHGVDTRLEPAGATA